MFDHENVAVLREFFDERGHLPRALFLEHLRSAAKEKWERGFVAPTGERITVLQDGRRRVRDHHYFLNVEEWVRMCMEAVLLRKAGQCEEEKRQERDKLLCLIFSGDVIEGQLFV